MARFQTMQTDRVTDLPIDGDKVVIRWKFTFTPADGPAMTMEEITLQRRAGDCIAEERFFHDPRQTRPTPRSDGSCELTGHDAVAKPDHPPYIGPRGASRAFQ